ncbi:MAG TPA: flippase [Pyrinomonadaceae bacterium]|nr:flippase [Pyrinomonadaceae bacterium]
MSEIPENTAPSTAGMTTKVVKGSLWTLGGQVLPMMVSFFATPFVIRFLGSEKYGVLILVGLIPTYFSFADFGMGIASTKFGSEAYGQGNGEKEAAIVRTAAFIAFCSSMAVALPIFLFSSQIIGLFNVPPELHTVASISLKITAVALVFGIIGQVVNTPMLARLRMDMNTATSAVPKILMAATTPFVLFLGGGIVEAVCVAFGTAALMLTANIYFSGRLLPQLYGWTINREYFRPLLKYGGAWLIGSIAGILLVNLEKIFLTRFVSVRALAYYSVAFTFSSIATMFSAAMIQSLIPAFSQLTTKEKRSEFDALFSRSIRLNLILTFPGLMFLFVIARPFFTIWAGPEFGAESTLPFYILLLGLIFNFPAYIPFTTIAAVGRTDVFAKLYWIEIFLYSAVAYMLIRHFGIVGAAAAWSLRVTADAIVMIWLSKHIAGVSYKFLYGSWSMVLGVAALLPPVFVAAFYDNLSPVLIGLLPVCSAVYAILIWKWFIDSDERLWIKGRAQTLLNFIR